MKAYRAAVLPDIVYFDSSEAGWFIRYDQRVLADAWESHAAAKAALNYLQAGRGRVDEHGKITWFLGSSINA